MRVICDTNVLISIALGGGETIRKIRTGWRVGAFRLLVSDELLDEFASVARRPHLSRFFREGETETQIEEFLAYGDRITPHTPYPTAPDPKDAFLLAMIRDGRADALVTGDKALLDLGDHQNVPILRPADFLAKGLKSN
jgi:putative PIN family toxin of toxin-antitoxin system